MRREIQHIGRGAMTLAELMISLCITAMVMAALAGMTFGVAKGWNASDGSQALQIQSSQVYNRVRYNLSAAKYVAQYAVGSLDGSAATPGSVCYWAADNWAGVSDGAPEAGEMAMIVHDPATKTLWLYQPIPVASMTTAQKTAAGTTVSYATISSAAWPATFEGLSYVTKTALGLNVKGATFAVDWQSSTTQRPVVEFTLVISRPPQADATQYDTAVLQSPTTQPD